MSGLRIAAIRLRCPDPVRSAAFYAAAFGADGEAGPDGVALRLGAGRILLVPGGLPVEAPVAANAAAFQHCALVVPDIRGAMARLDRVPGWTAISRAGPETLPAPSGGVTAFKFRDPDGHPFEFLHFPPGAVPAAWAGRGGPVAGIDHTAVTVADTARAVAFYEGLGFTVAGRGVNRGEEQARMDDVPAPVVEVTSLRPPGGGPPHLELLCYREPGTLGRPAADLGALATVVALAGGGSGHVPGPLADPDGHRLTILPGP